MNVSYPRVEVTESRGCIARRHYTRFIRYIFRFEFDNPCRDIH